MMLLMPIGVPGCGKSYYWDTKISKIQGSIRVNEEEIVKATEGSSFFKDYILSILKGYISKNYPIIYWDGLLISNNLRAPIIEIAKQGNYKTIGIVFDTPLDLCIMRCRDEHKSYSTKALQELYDVFRRDEPEYDEGFDDILIIKD